MGLDTALARLGRFGRWQGAAYVLLCLSFCLPASWQLFAIVFIGTTNTHHCKVDSSISLSEQLPMQRDGQWDQCSVYVNRSQSNATQECASGWEYDLDGFLPNGTIAMEWDLVCDKSHYIETSQTIFGLGNILGAAFCTPLGDRFGRKRVFFMCQALMNIFGLAMAFAPNYAAFCIFQFLTGALSQGLTWIGFVMACELFASQMRTIMAPLAYLFWSLGMLTLTAWAYGLRHWRHLQFAISATGFVSLLYYWNCPESLYWLVSRERFDEAMVILRKAAKLNKVPMPDNILSRPDSSSLQRPMQDVQRENTTMMAMFRSRKARRNVLVMFYMVFSNTMMYFGLSLMTGALPGDRYLNFFFVAVLEVPATFVATWALNRFGRRLPVALSHMLSAVFLALSACFVTFPVLDEERNGYLVTAMALLGKFGVAIAFVIELIYQQEIFPTPIRASGVGITAAIGMMGSVVAPYSVFILRLLPWVPPAVFAGLSVIAGLLALLLPETMGRRLPETLQEIEGWDRHKSAKETTNVEEGSMEEVEENTDGLLNGPKAIQLKNLKDDDLDDSGCFIPSACASSTHISDMTSSVV